MKSLTPLIQESFNFLGSLGSLCMEHLESLVFAISCKISHYPFQECCLLDPCSDLPQHEDYKELQALYMCHSHVTIFYLYMKDWN